jgi:hypothetical protein
MSKREKRDFVKGKVNGRFELRRKTVKIVTSSPSLRGLDSRTYEKEKLEHPQGKV